MSLYRVGSNKSSINNFPNVRPSLDLDFANTKTLDPRITFTRSTSGSYVGADGLIKYAGVNEARFHHHPTTGESLGLLVEEARTNLCLRSQEFDHPYFDNSQGTTVIANATTAPDGTLTADLLQEDTSTGIHSRFVRGGPYTMQAGQYYTSSVFVKPAGRTTITLEYRDNIHTVFNLQTLTVSGSGSGNANLVGYSITPLPNGWYRLTATSLGVGSYNSGFGVGMYGGGNRSYTGDDTSGVYVWGLQIENAYFPTSYIPTTTSAVTRSADVAQITGTNFSSWYRQDEGTMYAFFKGGRESNQFGYGRVVGMDGSFSMLSTNGSTDSLSVFFGTPALVMNSINNVDYWNVGNSAVVAYNSSSTIVTKANQSSSFSRTPNINGNITGWGLGSRLGSSTNMLNGTIKRLTYWPKRLPNSQLQVLTR